MVASLNIVGMLILVVTEHEKFQSFVRWGECCTRPSGVCVRRTIIGIVGTAVGTVLGLLG